MKNSFIGQAKQGVSRAALHPGAGQISPRHPGITTRSWSVRYENKTAADRLSAAVTGPVGQRAQRTC